MQTKSSTDGEETATEIEIATETGTSVAGEWMTIRVVMIRAVIGRNFFSIMAASFEKSYSKPFSLEQCQNRSVRKVFRQ